MKSKQKIFYGWWILVGAFVLNFSSLGILVNTLGVFVRPVTESLGFTRGAFMVYFSIGALSMMIMAPIIGKLLERYDIRLTMTISTTIMALAYTLLSQCRTLTQFYIAGFFLGIGGAGTHIIPTSWMVTNWFIEKRGLAMGIIFAATGAAGVIFNPLANWIILNYGWQTAYLVLGLIMGLTMIPTAAFLIRSRPSDKGLIPYGGEATTRQSLADTGGLTATEALRSSAFWWLALLIFFVGLVGTGMVANIVPYFTDIGYSPTTAATLMSLHMIMLVIGKVGAGYLCDRVGILKSYLLCLTGVTTAILLLFGAQWIWIAILHNFLYGLAIGVRNVLPPLMTSRALGEKHFAVIFGYLNIPTTLSTALGAPITGFIYDWTKSYYLAFMLYIILCIISAIAGVAALARSNKS
jgi:MFS family permease